MAADIPITSEVTSDVDPLIRSLQAGKQALDDFSTYANSLRIAPQITIDTATPTGAFRAMLATMLADAQTAGSALNTALVGQLSNIPVTLNLSAAQAQLQSLVTSVQNINLTFSAPSAQQIGLDIGNAAAAAFSAGVAGITFPSGGGSGGGGGGGSGGGGGFGGGRGRFGGYLLRRAISAARGLNRAEEAEATAGNSYESARAAEEEFQAQLRIIESIPVVGIPAAGIAEGVDLFTGTTQTAHTLLALGKAGDKYAGEYEARREELQGQQIKTSIGGMYGADKTSAQIQEERRLADEASDRKRAQQGQNDQDLSAKEQGAIELQHNSAYNKLNRLGLWAGHYKVLGGLAGVLLPHDQAAADADEESTRVELERQRRGADYRNTENDATTAAEKLTHGKDAAQKEIDATRQEYLKDNTSYYSARGIEWDTAGSYLRISGQNRAASDEGLKGKLQDEVDELQHQIDLTKDPAEQARLGGKLGALRDAMPAKIAEQKQREDIQDNATARSSRERISDLGDDVSGANLRASGDTRGASMLEYQNQLEEKTRKLKDAFDDEAGSVETNIHKKEKLNELNAQTAANTELLAARTNELALADKREAEAQDDQLDVMELRLQGRMREAAITQSDSSFNRRIEKDKAEGKDTSRLEMQKQTARDQIEKNQGEAVSDLNDQAYIKNLRNSGDTQGAGLAEIDVKYNKELRDAKGDPAKIAALQLNKTEEIFSFMVHTFGKGDRDHHRAELLQSGFNVAGMLGPGRGYPADPTHRGYAQSHGVGSMIPPDLAGHGGTLGRIAQHQHDMVEERKRAFYAARGYPEGHPELAHKIGPVSSAAGLNAAMKGHQDMAIADKWKTTGDKWDDIANKIQAAPTLIVGDFA